MAHPHSAGWSSGDWHRPIINLPFHWWPLGFFLLFFLHFCFVHFKVIYWSFLLLSFFFKFSFLLFFFIPIFLTCWFLLSASSSALYHLSMRVLVMSIDSNFVFEFIAWVMLKMLVHSICQKWIHVRVRAWLPLRVVHEATTFKGMRERVSVVFISSLFSLKLTGWCVFWLYGPGTHCHP